MSEFIAWLLRWHVVGRATGNTYARYPFRWMARRNCLKRAKFEYVPDDTYLVEIRRKP